MNKAEKQLREDLAMAYRLIAHLKMDDSTYTHISARLPGADWFLIMPFSLLFSEVTAEGLLKVDFEGNVISGNESLYNRTGYVIHGNTYKARPDINAVFHLHTHAGIAVSAEKNGLLPVSQFALHLYNRVAYYDYNSLELSFKGGKSMVDTLGEHYVMFLRNHGTLTSGRSLHEAFFYTYHLEQACLVQCLANNNREQLLTPSKAVCEKTNKDLLSFEEDLGMRDWKAWKRLMDKLHPDYKRWHHLPLIEESQTTS